MNDPVNHPSHYTAYPVEVIQLTAWMNFCRGNAVKYIARAGLKDPEKEIEDLKKAAWYINYEIDRLEKLKAASANVNTFVEKAKQYTAIDELTPELLRLFIQRIEIGERDVKYSRNSSQSIRIIYRDIGLVDSAMQPDEQLRDCQP